MPREARAENTESNFRTIRCAHCTAATRFPSRTSLVRVPTEPQTGETVDLQDIYDFLEHS